MSHDPRPAHKERDWSKSPLVIIVTLVSALIPILIYLTGKESLVEFFSRATATPTAPVATLSVNSGLFSASPTLPPPPATATATLEAAKSEPASPFLDGSPIDWLPAAEDLPPDMYVAFETETTNEYIAKQYENPAEMYANIRKWGRKTGYYRDYLNTQGCAVQGLRELVVQAVLYENQAGAQKALDWYQDRYAMSATSVDTSQTVGKDSFMYSGLITSDCDPPGMLEEIRIGFRSYNAIGLVIVLATHETYTQADLVDYSVRLARLIELRFEAEVK